MGSMAAIATTPSEATASFSPLLSMGILAITTTVDITTTLYEKYKKREKILMQSIADVTDQLNMLLNDKREVEKYLNEHDTALYEINYHIKDLKEEMKTM